MTARARVPAAFVPVAVAAAVLAAAACAGRGASSDAASSGAADSAAAGAPATTAPATADTADTAVRPTGQLPAPRGATVYTCGDGLRFSVRFRGDSAAVALPARTVVLPLARSASGARYAAGGVEYWAKGAEATLTAGGTAHACRGQPAPTPWDEARLLGVTFRAVGQEPGWLLDVDPERGLRFVGDYGADTVRTPPVAPVRDPQAGTVTYQARTEAHALTVVAREAPCQDAMSGEAFTHTVSVQLDGRDYAGCGRALAPSAGATPGAGRDTAQMTDTRWKLVELDGAAALPTAGPREVHLRLGGGAASGSTGCNSFRGPVRRDGERVQIGPLVTTRMACADPALNRQEQAFVRALEAADRAVVGGGRLTLFAGDRAVARFAAGGPPDSRR